MSVEKGSKQENMESKKIPDWLQKKLSDLEKLEAQRVPDWAQKHKTSNVEKLRQEIQADQESLERHEKIRADRREGITEKCGPEALKYVEIIREGIGDDIEKHLSKAKNKKEAEEILHLWQDLHLAVDILVEQNTSKPITEEEALKGAVMAFRPRDIEFRHLVEKPELK